MHVASAEWAWRAGHPRLLANFYKGVRTFRVHPYRRPMRKRPVVWERGRCRLLDYGPADGWPLLVVPSLVNRAYIMDLMPEVSLLDYLGAQGVRPMLLDWGDGRTADRQHDLNGLIVDRMEPALDWLRRLTGRRPMVLGYCMGGTLATALACRRHDQMAGLALLAAPWDFRPNHVGSALEVSHGRRLASFSGCIGSAPVDGLQALFSRTDPLHVPRKFARFAEIEPASPAADRFVAVEDWLNDGTPLNAEIAAECLDHWFGANAPARGVWCVERKPIRPEQLRLPVWLAIPERDRIVAPASAQALADILPNCEMARPGAGHIGMIVGRHAREALWTPLARWLLRIAAMQKKPW